MVKHACWWSQFAWKSWVTFIERIEVILQWDIVQSIGNRCNKCIKNKVHLEKTLVEAKVEIVCSCHDLATIKRKVLVASMSLVGNSLLHHFLVYDDLQAMHTYCKSSYMKKQSLLVLIVESYCYQEPVIYFIITSLSMIFWYSCAHKRFEYWPIGE